jgi:hypothetical protein
MKPKKTLPEGSEEMAELGKYLLVKSHLDKQPYYMIYEFYEADDGRRYWPRGAGNNDFEAVRKELERITGKKIKVSQ